MKNKTLLLIILIETLIILIVGISYNLKLQEKNKLLEKERSFNQTKIQKLENKVEALSLMVAKSQHNYAMLSKEELQQLGYIYLRNEKYTKVLNIVELGFKKYPKDKDFYFLRGMVKSAFNEKEAAIKDLNSAAFLGVLEAYGELERLTKTNN